jgi:hypothetical protein
MSNPTLALEEVFRRERGVTAEDNGLSDAVLETLEDSQLGLSIRDEG